MVSISLLPVGLAPTWASVEHGTWYARSAEFLGQPALQTLRWLRTIGDVVFASGMLAVASNPEQAAEQAGHGYVVRERRSGAFKRSFMLPQDIDADRISADFGDALLTVHLPQATRPKPKQISVKGGS